ncbi:hypothetical protein EGT07_10735 [Herbaspirillum sp. HC18]|nr:hypothetical protein EGT07_10735 [Herbaspirillum sp. HC18]
MIKYIGQGFWFVLFGVGIGYLAVAPRYRHIPPDQALLKLSISHAGAVLGNCRQRSAEELAKLARNMRAQEDCPRTRSPVTVELKVDGKLLYREEIAPAGLAHDGTSTVYRRIALPAGEHSLSVRINDNIHAPDSYYERHERMTLRAAQAVVIDFNRQLGGVLIK